MKATFAEADALRKLWEDISRVNNTGLMMTEEAELVNERLTLLADAISEENSVPLSELENLPPETVLGEKSRTWYLLMQAAMIQLDGKSPESGIANICAREGL